MKFSVPTNPCSFTLEQPFTRVVVRFDCVSYRFQICLAWLVLSCLVFFMLYLLLWKVLWILERFNIRFNQYGLINRVEIFLTIHFFKLDFTPCKANSHCKAWIYKKRRIIEQQGYSIQFHLKKYNLFDTLSLEWLFFNTILWNLMLAYDSVKVCIYLWQCVMILV